jgi:biotin synthase-like enzyme
MEDKINKPKAEKIVEGVDYYFENGLMVLTERYLKNRGYCCNNDCRHCPYSKKEKAKL